MRGDRCTTCGHVHANKGTRCGACQRYWQRHHAERPAWMWGQATRVAPPALAAVDLDAIPDADDPRARLARRLVHAALWQVTL